MSEKGPSAFWHPQLAKETLRAIMAKCEAGALLAEHERAYLAQAIKRILDGSMRADQAFGLVLPRGQKAQTLSDRNIRVYNRVEELRALFPSKSMEDVYADVAEEANQGNFDSPEAAGEEVAGEYLDGSYRSDGTPQRTATSPDNIEKIHRAIAKLPGFGK